MRLGWWSTTTWNALKRCAPGLFTKNAWVWSSTGHSQLVETLVAFVSALFVVFRRRGPLRVRGLPEREAAPQPSHRSRSRSSRSPSSMAPTVAAGVTATQGDPTHSLRRPAGSGTSEVAALLLTVVILAVALFRGYRPAIVV